MLKITSEILVKETDYCKRVILFLQKIQLEYNW